MKNIYLILIAVLAISCSRKTIPQLPTVANPCDVAIQHLIDSISEVEPTYIYDFVAGESIIDTSSTYIDGTGNLSGGAAYAQPVMGQFIWPLYTGNLMSIEGNFAIRFATASVIAKIYDGPGGNLLATSDNVVDDLDPNEFTFITGTWTFNNTPLTLNASTYYFVEFSSTEPFFFNSSNGTYPRGGAGPGGHWNGPDSATLTDYSPFNLNFILIYGTLISATVSGNLTDINSNHQISLSGPSPFSDGDSILGLISGATATILSQWTADIYNYQIDGFTNSPITGTSIASTSYVGISDNDMLRTFASATGHTIGDTWVETINSTYSSNSLLITAGGKELFKINTTGTYVESGEFVVGGTPGLSPSDGRTKMAALTDGTIIIYSRGLLAVLGTPT